MLAICLLLAAAVRIGILVYVYDPPTADARAYIKIATEIAQHGRLIDRFGQVAFYSPGFSLVLAPAFAMFGATPAVAQVVGLILSLVAVGMTYMLAREAGAPTPTPVIATGLMAVYLPVAIHAQSVMKESLTTVLVLVIAIVGVRTVRYGLSPGTAILAGVAYGMLMLAGPSAMLIILVLPAACAMHGGVRSLRRASMPLAMAAVAAGAVLAPWLIYTARELGRPVLTTNSAFNLYIGNNPSATGRFISIAKTPLAPDWAGLMHLSEVARADRLNAASTAWIRAEPVRAVELALRKLALFFTPQFPSEKSAKRIGISALGRWAAPVETVALEVLAVVGLTMWRRWPQPMRLLPLAFALFWIVHAAAYIIVRYRDPVMPFACIAAALPLAALGRILSWKSRITASSA